MLNTYLYIYYIPYCLQKHFNDQILVIFIGWLKQQIFVRNIISQIIRTIFTIKITIFLLFREYKLLKFFKYFMIFNNAKLSIVKILYMFTFYNYKFEVKISINE